MCFSCFSISSDRPKVLASRIGFLRRDKNGHDFAATAENFGRGCASLRHQRSSWKFLVLSIKSYVVVVVHRQEGIILHSPLNHNNGWKEVDCVGSFEIFIF